MTPSKKGYLNINGFKTYYEVYGTSTAKTPLLVIHGGPGAARYYLLGLALLARRDRQVIFYDQLGCGLSDKPTDESLWTVETFVSELVELRKQLQLDTVHILGHSWGGMLLIEYLLTQPAGIKSAILASSMISLPLYQKEADKIKKKLPKDVYKTMLAHEKAGTTQSDEYKKAYAVYNSHYIYRGSTFPPEFSTPEGQNGTAAYYKMWGPSEAYIDGTMRDWDMIPRLHEIAVPTLVISGEFDELTPKQAKITAKEIPNSQLEIISDASHCAHIEKEDEYLVALNTFLNKIEP